MNNFNLSDDKVNALLQMAAQKLGTDPQQLKNQLESGSLGDLTKNMDPSASSKINSFLQDPKKTQALLNNEKIQSMLGNMTNNK